MASGNVASIPPIFPINERSPEARVNSRWLNQILWAFKTEIKITDVQKVQQVVVPYTREIWMELFRVKLIRFLLVRPQKTTDFTISVKISNNPAGICI